MKPIDALEVVVPCTDLDAALRLFVHDLGFRLERIFPADAPRVAVVSLNGQTIRLDAGQRPGPARLHLSSRDADFIKSIAPGLAVADDIPLDFTLDDGALNIPVLDSALIVQKGGAGADWGVGRAGMQYRDLIPGRLGGRFIASHIRIPDGGPVPDYVHHHHVRFQMIYCYRGWVKVVYEDQGPPFVMRAGDCVLQPPHIRHRVLECSDAFEVVEIGCPAEHETLVDHDMSLPNSNVDHDREYSGQTFVFHEVSQADWTARRRDGFEVRDTGIGQATCGEASVVVVRRADGYVPSAITHDAELLFRFVLEGSVVLHCSGDDEFRLSAGDAFVVPSGMQHQLEDPSDQLQMLEVALPAEFSRAAAIEPLKGS